MNKKKNVLHLSSDPLDLKIKGGEQRSGYFNDFLNERYQVSSFVLPLYHTPDGRRSRWIYRFFPSIWFRSSGLKDFYGKSLRVFYKYRKLIAQAHDNVQEADMIVFEHPWMYTLFKSMIRPSQLVVYSSHNIEWQMIYEASDCDDGRHQTERYLKVLENDLTSRADLVIACTENDASYYKKQNAKKVVVIPNGSKYRSIEGQKSVLVASSDHKPNVDSLIQFLEDFDSSIYVNFLIVGGICDFITEDVISKFGDKIILFGECPDCTLNFLYSKCDSVLLPIVTGGGSNIKTAEALSLDKTIFATDFAMRGFDFSESTSVMTESSVSLLAQKLGAYYSANIFDSVPPVKHQFLWVGKRDFYFENLQALFDR